MGSPPPADEDEILKGEHPTRDEKDWINFWRELRREGPRVLDDAAKQVMVLGTGVAGLYVSILAALRISDVFVDLSTRDQALLFAPVGFWLGSSALAMVAFFPRKYAAFKDVPEDIRNAAKDIVSWKRKWLLAAVVPLAVGLLVGAAGTLFVVSQPDKQSDESSADPTQSTENGDTHPWPSDQHWGGRYGRE